MSIDFDAREEFQRLKDDLHNKNENKVSNTTFYWVMGGIGAIFSVGIIIVCGILSYAINRVDQIDIKHQNDHDKIIILETKMEHSKAK